MMALQRSRKLKLLLAFLCAQNVFLLATSLWVLSKSQYTGRRWWVDPILKARPEKGAFHTVFLKYKQSHHERFFNITRMSVRQFEELLHIVRNDLQKTSFRDCLLPEFRLAFTVCYLASGTSPVRMAEYWMIGKSTAYAILKETTEVIWRHLQSTHLAPPSKEEWKKIADGYWNRWNFPNCCGSLDGKHIRMQCPIGSGSKFYNYKQFFSLVLMALCDSNYCFTWVEVGDYGSLPDSSVFKDCSLGKAMEDGSINFPDSAPLPGTNIKLPYFIVGDEAFPLRPDLMRPYSRRNLRGEAQRIFNYRLSRARLTIENAFGVLSSRWRVLRTAMGQFPENVERIVLACVCLHNFIMKREEHIQGFKQYCPPTYVDRVSDAGDVEPGEWRRELGRGHFTDIGRLGGNRGSVTAIDQRNTLANYLLSDDGFVEWQWRSAYRGFEVNM